MTGTDWDLTPAAARERQRELSAQVTHSDEFGEIRYVAGLDVGFEQQNTIARGAVVVLDATTLAPVDQAVSRLPVTFPYVTGLLSFREVPVLLDALNKLSVVPDLLLCDGQGRAHPRRFGIACHLGLLTDTPAIGVGKSRLIGAFEQPGAHKGDWTPLYHREEVIGAVLRTRPGTKPLFISSGHRIGLPSAIAWVLRCTTRYRLPETTRAAHRAASH